MLPKQIHISTQALPITNFLPETDSSVPKTKESEKIHLTFSSHTCTRDLEGTQLGQLTPTDQRTIPDHLTLRSAIKAGWSRRKGGLLKWWHLSSQVAVLRDGALLSRGWFSTRPCWWEVLNEFLTSLCLPGQLLLCLLNWFYLSLWVFLLLPFGFSPQSHCGGVSVQLCGA